MMDDELIEFWPRYLHVPRRFISLRLALRHGMRRWRRLINQLTHESVTD